MSRSYHRSKPKPFARGQAFMVAKKEEAKFQREILCENSNEQDFDDLDEIEDFVPLSEQEIQYLQHLEEQDNEDLFGDERDNFSRMLK